VSRPRSRAKGRSGPRKALTFDLWVDTAELVPLDPIHPPGEPAALVRSLGDPPLGRHSVPGGNAVAAVVERASMLATALAASADLLGTDDD